MSAPGRGWYGAAAFVAGATVVITGLAGYVKATDLVQEVEGFEHLRGEQSTTFVPEETGEHTVYHEYQGVRSGMPEAFEIVVTAGDGSVVPVTRRGSEAYGWGPKRADALASFEATAGEQYQIHANGASGRLAIGPSIPGPPLYGFGTTLVVAGLVLVGCLCGVVVVMAKRRRAVLD